MLLNKLLSLQVSFVGFFDAKKSYITDGFIVAVMMLYIRLKMIIRASDVTYAAMCMMLYIRLKMMV